MSRMSPSFALGVFARDGYRCVRCQTTADLTVDHIFPRAIGGSDHPNNLRTLCRPCNAARPYSGRALHADLARDGLTMDDFERLCPGQQRMASMLWPVRLLTGMLSAGILMLLLPFLIGMVVVAYVFVSAVISAS